MRPRLGGQGVWLWLLGAVALFTVVAVTAILVPLALVPSEGLTVNQRVTAENNLRTTLVQFAGGSILLFGTALTLYINREGQITERFTRAIEHLGHTDDKLDVRLGGIYALERIARESSRDRGPIVEVLTAFLRQHARWNPDSPDTPSTTDEASMLGIEPGPRLRADFQAVATVLGRNQWSQQHHFDLREVDLRDGDLSDAHLEWARLNGAHLEGADLRGAHMEDAFLTEAHLERAKLMNAHLERAKLNGAHLQGAHLENAHLERADLVNAHLERARLINAHLEAADLVATHLEGGALMGAHLEGADLRGAQMEGAFLVEAHLEWARLNGAHLEGADLRGAHMEDAFLTEAHLERAKLTGAHLKGAKLNGADLKGVEGLTPAQVERVVGLNEATGVPPGLLGR